MASTWKMTATERAFYIDLCILMISVAHFTIANDDCPRAVVGDPCPANGIVDDSILLEVECHKDSALVNWSKKLSSTTVLYEIYLVYQCFSTEPDMENLQARQFCRDTFPNGQNNVTVSGLEGDYCIFRGCIMDDDDDIYNFKEQRNCTVTTSNESSSATSTATTSIAINQSVTFLPTNTVSSPVIGVSSTAALLTIGSPLSTTDVSISHLVSSTMVLNAQPTSIEPFIVAIIAVISTLFFSLCTILVFVLIWRRITNHRKQSQQFKEVLEEAFKENGNDSKKKFVYSTNFPQSSLITLIEDLVCEPAAVDSIRFAPSPMNANETTIVSEVPDKRISPPPQATNKHQSRYYLDISKESATSDYLSFSEMTKSSCNHYIL